MKVGEYVRTDTGIIEKLEGIHEQNETNETITKLNKMGGGRYAHILDINSEFTKEFDKTFSRGNIIKSSSNIIDLIEVGDYVNGMEVTGIGGTRWDKNDLHCYCEHNGNENWKQVMIPAKDIKSIVTKEQFSQMEYRIGE